MSARRWADWERRLGDCVEPRPTGPSICPPFAAHYEPIKPSQPPRPPDLLGIWERSSEVVGKRAWGTFSTERCTKRQTLQHPVALIKPMAVIPRSFSTTSSTGSDVSEEDKIMSKLPTVTAKSPTAAMKKFLESNEKTQKPRSTEAISRRSSAKGEARPEVSVIAAPSALSANRSDRLRSKVFSGRRRRSQKREKHSRNRSCSARRRGSSTGKSIKRGISRSRSQKRSFKQRLTEIKGHSKNGPPAVSSVSHIPESRSLLAAGILWPYLPRLLPSAPRQSRYQAWDAHLKNVARSTVTKVLGK